ncbi:MAG: chromosome segregation SMC family protein [Patescibacteria group bacterium]
MYLEHLTLHGFKSFANKTTIDFKPAKNNGTLGITAIVGPNGSGKSNVVDAIRWVLGEQSAKQLRGKKSGDVIFAGTDKKSRNSSAQVSLKLNNEDEVMDIGYSEVELSRQLFRSGDSEYLINGNKSRLQDIHYLLAKAHIGQRSYTVIGQGTIAAVLNSTPSDRKEFFDEAAGIKQYQLKRAQATNKLEQAQENLTQGTLQLNEITPRLKSLNRQMKRYDEREVVMKELHDSLVAFYSHAWHELTDQSKQQLDSKLTITKEKEALEKELAKLQHSMEKLATTNTDSTQTTTLQDSYESLLAEKQQLSQEKTQWQTRLDNEWAQSGKHNLSFIEKQISTLQKDIKKQKESLLKHENELSAAQDKQQSTADEYKTLSKKISSLQEKLFAHLQPDVSNSDTIKTIKENLQGLFTALENQITTAIKQNISLSDAQKDLDTLITDCKTELDKLPGDDESVDTLALQEELNALEKRKKELDIELQNLTATISSAKGSQNTIASTIQQKEKELEDVSEQRAALENSAPADEQEVSLKEKIDTLSEQISVIDEKITNAKRKLSDAAASDQKQKQELYSLQQKSSSVQQSINTLTTKLTQCEVTLARLQTKLEDIKENASHDFDNSFSEVEKLLHTKVNIDNHAALDKKIQDLKRKKELIGSIDEETKQEHAEIKERHEWLEHQINDLTEAINSLQEVIKDLDAKIEKQFTENLEKINKKFSHYFNTLFNGGKAALTVVTQQPDEAEEESEQKTTISGIEIMATPPGKRLQNITMLSGGEKALTSIALICAIIANNKSPFVVLDEVDAALDEANSARFSSILKELSDTTQFIVVTHNRATMEQAQLLYGVTMGDDGVSKLLSIKLEEGKQFANR